MPRAGNASGGGQPGWILKCKGWETDPNAYIYFITQAPVWDAICKVIGQEDWITHPDYAKPEARLPRLKEIFDAIEQWTMTKTKFEAMEILNKYDIPCGPILSMKELAEEPSLRATGTVVEVDHPKRGKYLSVGNPIKLSDSPADVKRSPLLGEHTDEILRRARLRQGSDRGDAQRESASDAAVRAHAAPPRTKIPGGSFMAHDKAAVRKVLDKAKARRPHRADRARGEAGLRCLRHRRAEGRRCRLGRRGGEAARKAWAFRW